MVHAEVCLSDKFDTTSVIQRILRAFILTESAGFPGIKEIAKQQSLFNISLRLYPFASRMAYNEFAEHAQLKLSHLFQLSHFKNCAASCSIVAIFYCRSNFSPRWGLSVIENDVA